MEGKWKLHSTTEAFRNDWTVVTVADIELPDGSHIDYNVVEQPNTDGAAITLAHVAEKVC